MASHADGAAPGPDGRRRIEHLRARPVPDLRRGGHLDRLRLRRPGLRPLRSPPPGHPRRHRPAGVWFLSTVDEGTEQVTIVAACLLMSAVQALTWAPMTPAAFASLRADLYPHGTTAFTTVQQLAGAPGGAVLISAHTIGSDGAD